MDISRALQEISKISGYPYSGATDKAFLEELQQQFPSLDIIEEIRSWKTWLMDNVDQDTDRIKPKASKIPQKLRKVNYRSRLRRWCKNAISWKAKPPNGQGPGQHKYEFEKKTAPDKLKIREVW